MVLFSHPHWWYFWKQVAAGVGVLALLFLMSQIDSPSWASDAIGWIALVAFVLWLADTIYEFVQWRTTRFAVTDQRVAYQSGVIRRRGVSMVKVLGQQPAVTAMPDDSAMFVELGQCPGIRLMDNPRNQFNQTQSVVCCQTLLSLHHCHV